jgi:hypothetical protein
MNQSAFENFQLLVQFIGWGDPQGGLWFIGLEESSVCKDTADIVEIHERDNLHSAGGTAFYECSPEPQEKKTTGRFSPDRTQIPLWEAKIAAPLSASTTDWREYCHCRLWYAGSRVFHFGKPKLATWPDHYEDLFGFAQNQRDAYYQEVRDRRFP